MGDSQRHPDSSTRPLKIRKMAQLPPMPQRVGVALDCLDRGFRGGELYLLQLDSGDHERSSCGKNNLSNSIAKNKARQREPKNGSKHPSTEPG